MQNKNKCRSFSSNDAFYSKTTKHKLNKQAQEAACPSRKRNVPCQERKERRREGRQTGGQAGGRAGRQGEKTEVSIPAGSQRNELVTSLSPI